MAWSNTAHRGVRNEGGAFRMHAFGAKAPIATVRHTPSAPKAPFRTSGNRLRGIEEGDHPLDEVGALRRPARGRGAVLLERAREEDDPGGPAECQRVGVRARSLNCVGGA